MVELTRCLGYFNRENTVFKRSHSSENLSRKIEQELNVKETKPPIVDQQRVVYGFQCDLGDAGYVGYTRGHLRNRVKGHRKQSSSIAKHYVNMPGTMPQDLLRRFKLLKKCRNKFDCLEYGVLFIRAFN